MRTLARTSFLLLLAASAVAQTPTPTPASTDALRRAFVDADGGGPAAIVAAGDALLTADKAGRAAFLATLRAIGAAKPPAAPADASTGPADSKPPASTPAPTPTPTPKAPEFGDDIKKAMADAVGRDADARKAGLGKLQASEATGLAALQQLETRGAAILARAVSTFLRKQLATNAIFAGQYAELGDFHPEGTELLLRWTKEAPRDAANAIQFRIGCLRALRDALPSDAATDTLRNDLKAIASKAQQARQQELFFGAVCALQQFGDATLFDQMKANVLKQAESAPEDQKGRAMSMLADLHYQARKYEEAATYFKAYVDALEKLPQPPPGMPTSIYNAACSLALAGKIDDAFQYLEKALAASSKSNQPLTKVLLDTDHDIDALRQDPRFAPLYEKAFGKPPAK